MENKASSVLYNWTKTEKYELVLVNSTVAVVALSFYLLIKVSEVSDNNSYKIIRAIGEECFEY